MSSWSGRRTGGPGTHPSSSWATLESAWPSCLKRVGPSLLPCPWPQLHAVVMLLCYQQAAMFHLSCECTEQLLWHFYDIGCTIGLMVHVIVIFVNAYPLIKKYKVYHFSFFRYGNFCDLTWNSLVHSQSKSSHFANHPFSKKSVFLFQLSADVAIIILCIDTSYCANQYCIDIDTVRWGTSVCVHANRLRLLYRWSPHSPAGADPLGGPGVCGDPREPQPGGGQVELRHHPVGDLQRGGEAPGRPRRHQGVCVVCVWHACVCVLS